MFIYLDPEPWSLIWPEIIAITTVRTGQMSAVSLGMGPRWWLTHSIFCCTRLLHPCPLFRVILHVCLCHDSTPSLHTPCSWGIYNAIVTSACDSVHFQSLNLVKNLNLWSRNDITCIILWILRFWYKILSSFTSPDTDLTQVGMQQATDAWIVHFDLVHVELVLGYVNILAICWSWLLRFSACFVWNQGKKRETANSHAWIHSEKPHAVSLVETTEKDLDFLEDSRFMLLLKFYEYLTWFLPNPPCESESMFRSLNLSLRLTF